MKRIHELKPLVLTPARWEACEVALAALWRTEIYLPILAELGDERIELSNAANKKAVLEALARGDIQYHRGHFEGRFQADISRELKAMGATWDRSRGTWALERGALDEDTRGAIAASRSVFQRMAERVADRLESIVPEKLAAKVNLNKIFGTSIYRFNKDFESSVKGVTIAPEFTDNERQQLAAQYSDNLRLSIADWTRKEVSALRGQVQAASFQGFRRDSMVAAIQHSYGTSLNKAKFLARQETSLLMSNVAQVRYESAGLKEYKWRCMAGTALHPVRPMHKALDGTIQSWARPPIVNEKGDRKHPGCDFNCRCKAIPIVRF